MTKRGFSRYNIIQYGTVPYCIIQSYRNDLLCEREPGLEARETEKLINISLKTEATHSTGGRPREDRCNSAILGALLELLIKVGYDNVSIDKIAALAKVSKSTIYRRWSNKAELVAEFVKSISAGVADDDAATELGDNLHDNMVSVVTNLCETISQTDGALVIGLVRVLQESNDLALLIKNNLIEAHMKPIIQVVDRAKVSGEIPKEADLTCIYNTILASIFAKLLFTKESLGKEFAIQLVDDVVMPLIRYHSTSGKAQDLRQGMRKYQLPDTKERDD